MRIFLGIELPSEIKKEINNLVTPLKYSPKGWENMHDYHMTLLFIGEFPKENLDQIHSVMDELSFRPFELTLGELSFFNRRIFYLSLLPSVKLMDLKRLVDKKFPEWAKKETKTFVPHITLKRWQRYEYDELAKGAALSQKISKSFRVKKLSLFESRKDLEGIKYHVVHETKVLLGT